MQNNSDAGAEIKCVIWDLDQTLWSGILLESDRLDLRPGIPDIIQTLDSRGILHSIASKNDPGQAFLKLKEWDLDQYFLYPEISWNAKSYSIDRIQKNLNLNMENLLFIDDQPYEREEVRQAHPAITCWDAADYRTLPEHPRLQPRFLTGDSGRRRLMYIQDMRRQREEAEFHGPPEEFLASLNMKLTIAPAREEDLKRAEELTIRTHQLNATGLTYDYNELNAFRQSPDHQLLICGLTDRFGHYGKIGLALIEMERQHWVLKLMLMSCRVAARGIGTVLLSHIMRQCRNAAKKLRADFRPTERNRMMYVSYKFANFKEVHSDMSGTMLLENDLSIISPFPPHIQVTIVDDQGDS